MVKENTAELVKSQLPNPYPCSLPSRIPWFQYPIIYDIRARPRKISSPTGSKGRSGHWDIPDSKHGSLVRDWGRAWCQISWALASTSANKV